MSSVLSYAVDGAAIGVPVAAARIHKLRQALRAHRDFVSELAGDNPKRSKALVERLNVVEKDNAPEGS